MKKNKHLGQLIKEEVSRQGLTAAQFAEMINCKDKNVYKIYEKSDLNTAQLGLISKALNRNFFLEIAENLTLSGMDDPEAIKEINQSLAVSQFVDVMPRVLAKLGHEPRICFGRQWPIEDMPVPNYFLCDYDIVFTVGCHLFDKLDEKKKSEAPVLRWQFESPSFSIDRWDLPSPSEPMFDLVLEYHTEAEWELIMKQVMFIYFNN